MIKTPMKFCYQCYACMPSAVKNCYNCYYEFYDKRKPKAITETARKILAEALRDTDNDNSR